MDLKREEKIRELINELRDFKLNFNSYLDDIGYIELVDSLIEGKIIALKFYLNYLNLDTLSKEFDKITFERGKAVLNLEIIKNFILTEIELELEYYKNNFKI
ncbi:hypothetical protein [Bacillus haynesii]|uniref:hypothetical protein n=1 Tax=Bacillus haynesii TaxID=1925021 RepID=UPI00227F3336|nr:hypothetical protein [Bacillus haynesii]HLL60473.1 hypothetical protein [Candidatus Nitrosocosmicus sp.]MCY8381455.1 hypothetical protein [Bacillus haynesii]MCY8391137.1 hypothetical protein [Bacillus haynesii]MCY9214523.1 hypothetical protein [Bacillus haynesii]MEC0675760.1 hypothetical protein [Bacillus haynesii]